MSKVYIGDVEEDPETGELVLNLPQDLLDDCQWVEGDTIRWEVNGCDVTIRKVNNRNG